MREDVYLMKCWHKDYAGDALSGWEEMGSERLQKMIEEEDKAFITPLVQKLFQHMNEWKHEPHFIALPEDYPIKKVKTPDGQIHEVIEYETYEILKIPHYLDVTLEDVKIILQCMNKSGVGKWSLIKLLEVWYLGYNEEASK